MGDVTRVLSVIEQGDSSAAAQLWPLMYEELRKLAAARMAQETPDQTLQATALVHAALARGPQLWCDRFARNAGYDTGAAEP